MGQPDANWCAKTNAKTNAIHAKSISWIPKVEKPMATNKNTKCQYKNTSNNCNKQFQPEQCTKHKGMHTRNCNQTKNTHHWTTGCTKMQPTQLKYQKKQHHTFSACKSSIHNAQGTTQSTSQGTTQCIAKGQAQCTANGTTQGTAQATAQDTAQYPAQATTQGTTQGTPQGTTQGPSPGHNTAQGTAQCTAQCTTQGTTHGTTECTTESTTHGRTKPQACNPTLQYTISIGFCKEIFAKPQIIENTGPFVTRASLYGTFWGPIKGFPPHLRCFG